MGSREPQTDLEKEFQQFILKRDVRGVVPFLLGLSWKERRSLNDYARYHAKSVDRGFGFNKWESVVVFTVLASLTESELAKRRDVTALCESWNEMQEETRTLITGLDPFWMDAYIENVVAHTWSSWRFVFDLYQGGYCRRPVNDRFRMDLVAGVNANPQSFLTEHAELLAPEIYDLFALPEFERVEGLGKDFANDVVKLCEEEWLDRTRMIHAAQFALGRATKTTVAKWLADLIDHLSSAENVVTGDDIDGILALLDGACVTSVNWALDRLAALQKEGVIPASQLLEHIRPALQQKSKSSVNNAIRLITRAVKKQSSLHRQACLVVSDALGHRDAAVQKSALKFISTFGAHGDEELRSVVESFAETIAPSLQEEVSPWITSRVETIEIELKDLSRVLAPEKRLTPMADVADFVERQSHFWQSGGSIEELSLLLDGFSRFPVNAESEAQAAALAKQLQDGNFLWELAQRFPECLGWLATCWSVPSERAQCEELLRTKKFDRYALPNILLQLTREIAARILIGETRPLLSTPTHEGSWIDPVVLARRLKAAEDSGRAISETDVAIAFLRLAEENRDEALKEAAELRSETGEAFRRAIAGDGVLRPDLEILLRPEKLIEKSSWPKPRIVERAEVYVPRVEVSPQADLPMALHSTTGPDDHLKRWACIEQRIEDCEHVPWALSVWPGNRDPVIAQLLGPMSRTINETGITYTWLGELVMIYLNAPAVPLMDVGYQALALGLASAGKAIRSAATDALIANLEYKWFEPDRLGQAIARMFEIDLAKTNRLVEVFREAATVGNLHANRSGEVIAHSLAIKRPDPPTGYNKWLQYFAETRTNELQLPEASQAALRRLPQKGAWAKSVRKILGS